MARYAAGMRASSHDWMSPVTFLLVDVIEEIMEVALVQAQGSGARAEGRMTRSSVRRALIDRRLKLRVDSTHMMTTHHVR